MVGRVSHDALQVSGLMDDDYPISQLTTAAR